MVSYFWLIPQITTWTIKHTAALKYFDWRKKQKLKTSSNLACNLLIPVPCESKWKNIKNKKNIKKYNLLIPVSQNGSRKWAKPETDEGVQSRLSAHLTTCQNEMDFSASANKHIYAMFIWSYSFPFLNLLRQGYHLQIKQGQKRHRFYETDNKVCFGELFWPKLLSHESQWRVSRPSEAYGAGREESFSGT